MDHEVWPYNIVEVSRLGSSTGSVLPAFRFLLPYFSVSVQTVAETLIPSVVEVLPCDLGGACQDPSHSPAKCKLEGFTIFFNIGLLGPHP